MNRSQPAFRDILGTMPDTFRASSQIHEESKPGHSERRDSSTAEKQSTNEIERNHQTDDGENEPHHENLPSARGSYHSRSSDWLAAP